MKIERKYNSIIEAIAHHADDNPDKLCLADSAISASYIETWRYVSGLADYIKGQGINKGDCVLAECNQSVNFFICEMAVQLAGAIFVPLEKKAALDRILAIAKETGAKLFIGNREIPELKDVEYFDIGDTCKYSVDKDILSTEFPLAEDVAEILFSTGTTGKSKGIVLTHLNDVALAENVKYGTEMKENNVELIPMPLSHSHGLRRTYGNMLNSSSVVFIDGVMFLKKVFDMMDKYGVTAIDLSPTMLSIIFKLGKDQLGDYSETLDYIQLGSAPLPEDDKEHLSRILPKTRLYNFYGSTEAGCSCILDFNSMSGKKGCIGKPTVNAHFIVVDDDRNEIKSSPENMGLLASSGDINMREYFGEPELTEETMKDGYIFTKDLGYIDENGFVYMLGRKDDVINFGGIKISPEEIESAVKKNAIVKDCACIGLPDKISGQVPKLFISLEDGAEYDAKLFKAFLMDAIDANKQPSMVEIIDEIPRTFNGKILRRELSKR